MREFLLLAAVAAYGAAIADDGEGLVEQASYNAWHFRVGPVLSPRVRAKVSCPRRAMPAMPKMDLPTSGTAENVPADPSAGFVARQYADGYVRPDRGTEDPDSIIAGLTWDWGAKDVAAQYSGGRIEFRSAMASWSESTSASVFSSGSGSESDRDLLVGVEAIGGWTFFNDGAFDAAVDAGFRFYGSGCLDAASKYGMTVTTTRDEYRFVDSYDASGWKDVPQGPHAGTPGGPGRIIGALPTRQKELMDSSMTQETETYSEKTKLDYRIWELRLGPTLGWKATDWLAVRGGAYGLCGLVDASLHAHTRAPNGAHDASSSTCGAVFGMAFGISAQANITDNIFLMAGVEYDWWADSVELNAGGADAEIKLSDMTVSLGLGVEF